MSTNTNTVETTPAPEVKITKKSDLPARATDAQKKENKTKALAEARSAAASALQKNNRAEFNSLIIAEAAARGYTWAPQPTPEEKALAEAQRLLAEFPNLKDKLAGLAGS